VGDAEVAQACRELADTWRAERAQRQARRQLDIVDFDAVRDTGFLTLAVPSELGGAWSAPATTTRPIADSLRALAGGDPAVALVSAMHPAVMSYWLLNAEPADDRAWQEQRQAVFATALAGERWGTITSEPGSGGDIMRSKAIAERAASGGALPGDAYSISGDKHFGSGSGIVDWMVTTARPTDDPDGGVTVFAMHVAGRVWDGSDGMQLTGEWDGVGMAATQSHAMRLASMPAVRIARPGPVTDTVAVSGPTIAVLFTAVVLGVVDEAMAFARQQLRPRSDQLRPYEQVEWTTAVTEHWCAQQSFEGALRAIEAGDSSAMRNALCAKQSVAELAESIISRLARVVGGGSYSRRNPLAHWYEDVRALGFLRPPWGLAFDALFALSFD
jgi:alkylation response protein AidB-like acyl-CoA dehydrogenase